MQLTQKLLPTVNVVARVSMLFSLSIIVPILVAWWNNDAGLWPFIDALIGLQIVSAALWLLTRNYRRELLPRDGFILVVSLWTALPAVAAVPLMLFDPAMSFTNAYFETMCHLGDYSNNIAKEEPKQPSIVAIMGSSHLDGVCDLLKNERLWPSHIQMNVVHTERYSKSHPYTQDIVNDVEEYDRGVRVKECMRNSI